jgi:hypothetical protein
LDNQSALKHPNICPVCASVDFSWAQVGFILHHTISRCGRCGSEFSYEIKQDGPEFRLQKVGSAYSNGDRLNRGRAWSPEELTEDSIHIYPDAKLLAMANGDVDDEFFAGENPEESGFFPITGEIVVFTLKNVYSWEDRPKGGQAAAGRSSILVQPGGWFKVKLLTEPRLLHELETLEDGTLILTNKRYLFIGKNRHIDQPLRALRALFPYQDGLGIARKEKTRIEYYKGNYYWPLVGAVLSGLARRKRGTQDAGSQIA